MQALKAISNYCAHRQKEILSRPALLLFIRDALLHPPLSIQRAAVQCVHHLVSIPGGRGNASSLSAHREIREAEIDLALRSVMQTPTASMFSPEFSLDNLSMGIGGAEDSKDIRHLAKEALRWIEGTRGL